MIAKRIDRKKGQPGSFAKLIDYLLDDKFLEEGERVVFQNVTNCSIPESVELSKQEIEITQEMNQRVQSDKTYHLVLSFRQNDKVSEEMLEEIEQYFCDSLGFGEHQRMSVVHGDTNNTHIHIAINKIHPETYKLHDPFQDKRRMQIMCRDMERKYGLEPEPKREEKVHMMASYGMESFSDWLKSNAKEDLLQALKMADSWEELQKSAAMYDIEFRKSGAGMAISHRNEKIFVKASDLDRSFSFKNLTEKFGEFTESKSAKEIKALMSYKKSPLSRDSQDLWSDYLSYKNTAKTKRNELVSQVIEEKSKRFAAINDRVKSQRALLKTNFRMSYAEKKVDRSKISAEYLYKKQELSKWYKEERQKISRENSILDWGEWLQERGSRGDMEAIKALKGVKNKERNPKSDEAFVYGFKPKDYLASVRYEIKSNGDLHYKVSDSVIIDAGSKIIVKAGASKEAVEFAIDLSRKRFGNNLQVKGNSELTREIKTKISQERGFSR